MAKIVWTGESEKWLKDIYDYISADNPATAEKVVAGICRQVRILKDFPKIGHVFRDEPEGEIRILLYGHYRIAYLLTPDTEIIILGIFHGALDIDRLLF